MRRIYRFIIFSALIFADSAYAWEFFLEGLEWRATETNDWAYINSEQLPHQTINYQTIDFTYAPGFRMGAMYASNWDALLSYTRFYTTASDTAVGNLRPAFSGSVTASPHGYLFLSGQVKQSIDFNMFDLVFGKPFYPSESIRLHPIVGVMGGWINQSIHAAYQGSLSTRETITNNFTGIGPKAGIDTHIRIFNYHDYQTQFIAALAASYLLGHWNIRDLTTVIPHTPIGTVYINGGSNNLGALALQGTIGIKVEHKNFSAKLAYEISDWFNQTQFFDNDTGTHNNDLILQGLNLGIAYQFS